MTVMNVLIAAAESWPYIKVGGLGDVTGALPKALKGCGVDARVIIPQYRDIPEELKEGIKHKADFYINLGWRRQYCGINEGEYDGVTYYFIDNEYYFGRGGIYGHYDDGERFAFFCKAVLEALIYLDFKADVVHCNDWHTALIPVLLEKQYGDKDSYKHIRTLYTIHNLSYQGIMPSGTLMNLLSIGFDENIEYYGNENLMKAGLIYSDSISVVSPTYAMEIQEPALGEGLDGVLRDKNHKLRGLLNGIDFEIYNPETDNYIYHRYGKADINKRKANKLELQREMGLPEKDEVLLIGIVSRLVPQKGFELVEQVLNELLAMEVQLVVLGSGEKRYEDMFRYVASYYPDKAGVVIGFSEVLAHKIYAGADMFLMPSVFEPCGLGQLIALRYGAIPIVRATGGLRDTVFPFDKQACEGNGFTFQNYNPDDMLDAIKKAVELYKRQDAWQRLQQNAMECDNSWAKSAVQYVKLYQSLV